MLIRQRKNLKNKIQRIYLLLRQKISTASYITSKIAISKIGFLGGPESARVFNKFEVQINIFSLIFVLNLPLSYSGISCNFASFSAGKDLSMHCVKNVRIRSYSSPYFPAFGLHTDQNNSECKLCISLSQIRLKKW